MDTSQVSKQYSSSSSSTTNRLTPSPSSSSYGYVDKYELQRREFSQGNWETIDAYDSYSRRTKEIQIIRTRADPGSIITSGSFRLNLNYDGVNDFDAETPAQSSPVSLTLILVQLTRNIAQERGNLYKHRNNPMHRSIIIARTKRTV